MIAGKHILRYLRGTVYYGLKYDVNQRINLEGYVDSDWEGSAIDRKNTSGCFFSMGSGVISWFSRKQSCMALSKLKKSMSQLVQLVVRQYGYESYCRIYLISTWMLLVYIVTTRVL